MGCQVSVVIPVHNVESYLHQTLVSVADQSLTDIEVICVDDGSTDGSAAIVQSYVEKDDRFVLIRQEALGAGEARNKGLTYAKGEFVIFLDGDDFFDRYFLEKLYKQITLTGADICMCGAMNYDCESGREAVNRSILKKSYLPKEKTFSAADYPDTILLITSPAPWSKLYKRSFLENKGLSFQSLANSNDVFFYVASFALAGSITYVEDRLVYYRQGRPGSLQSSSRIHSPDNYAIALTACRDFLDKQNLLDKLSVGFGEFAANMIAYNLNTAKSFESHGKAYEAGRRFVFEYEQICLERKARTGEKWSSMQSSLISVSYAEYLYESLISEKRKKEEALADLRLIKSKKRFAIPRGLVRLARKLLDFRVEA